eukprot:scaffold112278_cov48-Phaeocystis_antarctica.AAC.2
MVGCCGSASRRVPGLLRGGRLAVEPRLRGKLRDELETCEGAEKTCSSVMSGCWAVLAVAEKRECADRPRAIIMALAALTTQSLAAAVAAAAGSAAAAAAAAVTSGR